MVGKDNKTEETWLTREKPWVAKQIFLSMDSRPPPMHSFRDSSFYVLGSRYYVVLAKREA